MAFDISKLTKLFQLEDKDENDKIIGIDIGASSIKVVGLHNEDGVPTLDTYGELQLGPYAKKAVGQTVSVPEKRLIEALVDIIRESALDATNVAFSVSSKSSFMTTLTVDTVSETEVEAQIPIAARKYIPVPIAEVTLDWFVLKADTTKKQTQVLLAAVFNEAFQESERVLSGAGLNTVVSELEPFGAVRGAVSTKDTSVALLDFGASGAKLYIVRGGMVQDVHIFRLSGEEITQIFAESQKLEWSAAEELKRSIGITPNKAHQTTIDQVRTRIQRGMREVSNRLRSEETESGIQITKVYLLGGGALLPGLTPLIQDTLGRQLEFVDPFSKVAYPAFLEDTLAAAGPSFCVALGVALRGLHSE